MKKKKTGGEKGKKEEKPVGKRGEASNRDERFFENIGILEAEILICRWVRRYEKATHEPVGATIGRLFVG